MKNENTFFDNLTCKFLAEQTADIIFTSDSSWKLTETNTTACELTGFTKDELIGMPVAQLFSKEPLEKEPLRFDLLEKGHPVIVQRNFIRKDKSIIIVEMNTRKLSEDIYISIVRDVSDRVERFKEKEVEIEYLVKELEQRNRAIAIQKLILSAKDELLTELKYKIFKSIDISENDPVREIINLIDENINKNKEWELFKIHFEEIHPRFFGQLREIAPNITRSELKLCAYIRINMSTKEIASVMHIVVDSVSKKRNRLRKKLKLKSNINLNKYLHKI